MVSSSIMSITLTFKLATNYHTIMMFIVVSFKLYVIYLLEANYE